MLASVLVLVLSLGAGALAPAGSQGGDPCKCCAGELVEVVLDQEGDTQEAFRALTTLRDCPQETVRKYFPRLLRELADPKLRRLVAMTLADYGERKGVEELRAQLRRETNLQQQVELASLLVSYGDPSGYPSVVVALESDEPRLRKVAISLLSRFVAFGSEGEIDVSADLRTALQDSVLENRIEALNQVVSAVKSGLSHEELEEPVERISINDPEESVREAAQRTLKLIDPENRRILDNLRKQLEKRKSGPPSSDERNGAR